MPVGRPAARRRRLRLPGLQPRPGGAERRRDAQLLVVVFVFVQLDAQRQEPGEEEPQGGQHQRAAGDEGALGRVQPAGHRDDRHQGRQVRDAASVFTLLAAERK